VGGSVADLNDVPHVPRRQRPRRSAGHPHNRLRWRRHLDDWHVGELIRADHQPPLPHLWPPHWPRHLARLHALYDHPRALLQAPSWRRKRHRRLRQCRLDHDHAVRAAEPSGERWLTEDHADHGGTAGQPGRVCRHVEAAVRESERQGLRALRRPQLEPRRERGGMWEVAGALREHDHLEEPLLHGVGDGHGDRIHRVLRAVRTSREYQ